MISRKNCWSFVEYKHEICSLYSVRNLNILKAMAQMIFSQIEKYATLIGTDPIIIGFNH